MPLLNLAILLLERQRAAQVRDFERNGGFSEHLSGVRKRAFSGCRSWRVFSRRGTGCGRVRPSG
ncbi:hypothetical protein [Victivallis vadensis]|uniref:hypothetical protein n=1 Tax=Victivallis vadensis TaxID=172901 RepID=UPI00346680C6